MIRILQYATSQKSGDVEVIEVGRQRRVDTGQVGLNRRVEGCVEQATQGVEHRTIEQRRTIVGNQRVEAGRCAIRDQAPVVRREMAECAARPLFFRIGRGGTPKRSAQIGDVVGVRLVW